LVRRETGTEVRERELNLMALGMAVLLLLGGAVLIFLAFNRKLQPFLQIGESLYNWRQLIFSHPSEMQILSSHPFGYSAQVPHYRGWYRDATGRVVRARAARVHVAADQLARLQYVNGWTGEQILDTSAFCIQLADASDTVDYLNRSGRFEIVVADDQLRSLDGYPMNCHLAVHYSIEAEVGQRDFLETLMQRIPNLKQDIEERVAGVLREEFSRSDYRDAMYNVPRTVNRLNQAWVADDDLPDVRRAMSLHYSALVIKPREEAERRFLSTPGAGMARLKDRIERVDEELQRDAAYWNSQVQDKDTALRNAVRELLLYPPRAVENSVKGLQASVREMGSVEPIVHSVDNLFLGGQRALARGADKLVAALEALQALIQALVEEGSALRGALNQHPLNPHETTPKLTTVANFADRRLVEGLGRGSER